MSEFDDLISGGFGEMLEALDSPTILHKGVTRECMSSPVLRSKQMREFGYWPKFCTIAELARADFLALQLVEEESIVLYQDSQKVGKLLMRVVGIEDDPVDSCVKVTLQEEPTSLGEDPTAQTNL